MHIDLVDVFHSFALVICCNKCSFSWAESKNPMSRSEHKFGKPARNRLPWHSIMTLSWEVKHVLVLIEKSGSCIYFPWWYYHSGWSTQWHRQWYTFTFWFFNKNGRSISPKYWSTSYQPPDILAYHPWYLQKARRQVWYFYVCYSKLQSKVQWSVAAAVTTSDPEINRFQLRLRGNVATPAQRQYATSSEGRFIESKHGTAAAILASCSDGVAASVPNSRATRDVLGVEPRPGNRAQSHY